MGLCYVSWEDLEMYTLYFVFWLKDTALEFGQNDCHYLSAQAPILYNDAILSIYGFKFGNKMVLIFFLRNGSCFTVVTASLY